MHKLFHFVLIYFFYYLYIVDGATPIPTDYFAVCQEDTLDKYLRLIIYLPDNVEDEGLYYKILHELSQPYMKSLKKELESHFAHVQILNKLYSNNLPKDRGPPDSKLNNIDRFFGNFGNSIIQKDFKLAPNAHVSGILPTIEKVSKEDHFESVGGKHLWINLHVAFVDNVPAYKKHIDVLPPKTVVEADFFSLKDYRGKLILLSTEKFLTNWAQFLYEEKVRYSSVYPYDVDLVQYITSTVGRYTCKTRSTQYSLRHLVDTYNHLYPSLFFDEATFLTEHGVAFVMDSWRNLYTNLEKQYFLKWAEDKSYFYLFMTLFLTKIPKASIMFQTLGSLHGISKYHVNLSEIDEGFKSFAVATTRKCTDIKDPAADIIKKHPTLTRPSKRTVPVFLNHGQMFPSLDSPQKAEDFTANCPQNIFAKVLNDNNALVIYTSRSNNRPALDLMKKCSSILRHDAVYYDISSVKNYVQYAFDLMKTIEVHLSSIESKYRGAMNYISVDYVLMFDRDVINIIFLLPKSPRPLLAPQLFNVFGNGIPKTALTRAIRFTGEEIFKNTPYRISLYDENDFVRTGQNTLQDCSCQLLNNFNRKNHVNRPLFDFSKPTVEYSSAISKLYCCMKDTNVAWDLNSHKIIVILADSPPSTQNKIHQIPTKSVFIPAVKDIESLSRKNRLDIAIVSDPKYIHIWKTFFQNYKYPQRITIIPSTPNTLFTRDVNQAIKNLVDP